LCLQALDPGLSLLLSQDDKRPSKFIKDQGHGRLLLCGATRLAKTKPRLESGDKRFKGRGREVVVQGMSKVLSLPLTSMMEAKGGNPVSSPNQMDLVTAVVDGVGWWRGVYDDFQFQAEHLQDVGLP